MEIKQCIYNEKHERGFNFCLVHHCVDKLAVRVTKELPKRYNPLLCNSIALLAKPETDNQDVIRVTRDAAQSKDNTPPTFVLAPEVKEKPANVVILSCGFCTYEAQILTSPPFQALCPVCNVALFLSVESTTDRKEKIKRFEQYHYVVENEAEVLKQILAFDQVMPDILEKIMNTARKMIAKNKVLFIAASKTLLFRQRHSIALSEIREKERIAVSKLDKKVNKVNEGLNELMKSLLK